MLSWQNRYVLVTGGASFIGSHLTDALVERGAKVRIVDDLSSGKLENIQGHLVNSTGIVPAQRLKAAGNDCKAPCVSWSA